MGFLRAGNRMMQFVCAFPLVCAIAACGSGGSDGGGSLPPPPPSITLTIAKTGNGTGTITSNPAGIDCGATCTLTVSSGTVVTLTAAPSPSNSFTNWGGVCAAGSATCAVPITADQTVTATFTRSTATPTVRVTKAGSGAGSVTCNANGGAPSPCGTYSWGAQISVIATPNGGSVFAGWSGGCSGTTSPCTIAQLTADTAVTATFTTTGQATPSSVRLGAALGYTLAVHADGRVLSIGSQPFGGSGTALPGTAAKVITGLNGISSVVASYNVISPNFAIAPDGSVRGWGTGILGASVTGIYGDIIDTPILVPAAGQATALSVCKGGLVLHILYALHRDGTVSYTPATNTIGPGPTRTSTTQTIPGLTSVISMSENCTGLQNQTVVVKSDGTVWSLSPSATGSGSTSIHNVTVAQIIGLPAITQVSCGRGDVGSGFCLARATDGTVWAWGDNSRGQLGDGTLIGRTIPIQVPGLASIAKVIAGLDESYVIDSHGAVFSWGTSSDHGVEISAFPVLGRTTTNNAWVPGLVQLPAPATALAASGFHAVVLLSNGTIWSWGSNTHGELGDGTSGSNFSVLPVQALGLNLN